MTNTLNKKINTSVSVVIPTWNSASTIESSIRSCLNQTFPPIEILVCDDGSTDESKNIVESINDKRVVWIGGTHSGSPGKPRNRGVLKAKGFYIAFCDSDDEWLPEKLEQQITKMQNDNTRASCTNAIQKINKFISGKLLIKTEKNKFNLFDLFRDNKIICSSSIVQTDILRKIGGFSEITNRGIYADYICWLRVSTLTNFSYVDNPLVIYNDHPETSMRSAKLSDFLVKKTVYSDFLNDPQKISINFSRKLQIKFLGQYLLMRHFPRDFLKSLI